MTNTLRRTPAGPDQAWLDRVRRALDRWAAQGGGPTSSILGSGAVEVLEGQMAAILGVRYTLALPSATIGLRLALEAVGVRPGTEVVTSAYDWPAAIAATLSLGAQPVVADITVPECAVDPIAVEAVIGNATRAVVVTHLMGVPADVLAIRAVCDPQGIAVIEDCAQGFGGEIDGQPVGALGAASVFSFGRGKVVDAGEAGILATDDEDLWRRAVQQSQHPSRQLLAGIDEPTAYGLLSRIHPMAAVLALDELCDLDSEIKRRSSRVERLLVLLVEMENIVLPRNLGRSRVVGPELPVITSPTVLDELSGLGVQIRPPGYQYLSRGPVVCRRPTPVAATANETVRCLTVQIEKARRVSSRDSGRLFPDILAGSGN